MKKHQKDSVSDVESARNNFSNLLRKWNNKKHHNHEDRNHHYSSTAQLYASQTDYDEFDDAASPPVQKSKRLKVSRKTKKRITPAEEIKTKEPAEEAVASSTCMLKLFDRSVDLAPFNENSPLYALCRAWVKNPIGEIKDQENEHNEQSESMNMDENEELIYQLPSPETSKRDLRIPKSVKKPTTSIKEIDKAINSLKNEKLSTLLEMNKKRWKEVRSEWKKASLENEKRYRKSWWILKDMYEKTVAPQTLAEL